MNHSLWQTILGEIELTVSRGAFSAWFKNTELIEQSSDGVVTIGVPNIFAKRQFEVKFDSLISEALKKNDIDVAKIKYQVQTSQKRKTVQEVAAQKVEEIAPAPAEKTVTRPITGNSLNPRYTFDSYIVGSSNDLAYTACQTVAKYPGSKYNPIFIYGGVGLGKTHLIQAVGNEIARNDPKSRIAYISTETFVNEFLEYLRFKKKGFSDRYRNVDVLIVDDIQFIAGKERTQEEFFHTFNALHQANKQIIISSDKSPKNIPTLTERLRSRFEWGMMIDIQLPDFETRSSIIESKAAQAGIEMPKETVEYMASNIKTNIRELEGALNQLLAFCEMRGVVPDLQTASGLIGDVRQTRPQHLTAKQVVDKTARHFQVDAKDILSPKRDKHIVVPRQIAMYLLRSELHMSFPKIATELGRKDHTTAIHSVEKIEKAIKLDFMIREQVSDIREKLYA